MLPNLDEIYSGEYVGGNYLIFDIDREAIPAGLFFDLLGETIDSEYKFKFFSNLEECITFAVGKGTNDVTIIDFKIKDGNVTILDLFTIMLDKEGKLIEIQYSDSSVDSIERMYRIRNAENGSSCQWEYSGEEDEIVRDDWHKFFSIIDIYDTVPIWEEQISNPLHRPVGTLADVAVNTNYNLKNCLLSFNRDIPINSLKLEYMHGAYIEEKYKWRLSIYKISNTSNDMVFEYLNPKGERVVETWWDGRANKWNIPAGLINMSKYGIDIFCKDVNGTKMFGFCTVVEDITLTREHATDYATALELIQEAALRLGLPIPYTIQTVIESDKSVIDKNSQLLLGGLNAIAYYATTLYDWPAMRIDGSYTVLTDTVKEIDTHVSFPGFDKMITDGFICNLDSERVVRIQQTTEDKYVELANMPQNGATAIDNEGFNLYIFRGNKLCFGRPLKKDSVLHCVYKTRFPVLDSVTGQPIPRFSNDKDLSYIDSELLVIGIILNYKSYIGDDYRKEAQVFDEYAKYLKSTRAGNRIIKETNQISNAERFPDNRLAY
jgi:hypothetical protein